MNHWTLAIKSILRLKSEEIEGIRKVVPEKRKSRGSRISNGRLLCQPVCGKVKSDHAACASAYSLIVYVMGVVNVLFIYLLNVILMLGYFVCRIFLPPPQYKESQHNRKPRLHLYFRAELHFRVFHMGSPNFVSDL